MIKLDKTGKTNSSHGIQIEGVTGFKSQTSIEYKRKNTEVFFTHTDNTKFKYEKGYRKDKKRKVTFKGGKAYFRYDGFTYDITDCFEFEKELWK